VQELFLCQGAATTMVMDMHNLSSSSPCLSSDMPLPGTEIHLVCPSAARARVMLTVLQPEVCPCRPDVSSTQALPFLHVVHTGAR
jgi:hypothetical protein